MPAVGVPAVAKAIVGLFGNDRDSDCTVSFCFKEGADDASGEPQLKRPRLSATEDPAISGATAERWDAGARDRSVLGAAPSSATAPCRPQLRVLLGSAAEAHFARAAISYAYTGVVAADDVPSALEVRRQATYLQIDGCAAACDELLVGMLAATAPAGGPAPAAVEFMSCWAVLPDPAEDPAFAPVLVAAKEALVRHFGDALAALNTSSLRQLLLQLPAAGVDVLLSSDSFGTDSEDSVLLLLATWMKANHSQTDAATRERLCRLCLSGDGRSYEWIVSQQELLEAMGRLSPFVYVKGSFSGVNLHARGFEYNACLEVSHAAASASLFLQCSMPDAYDVPASRLGSGSKTIATTGLDARLTVHSWSGGTRCNAYVGQFTAARPGFGVGRGTPVNIARRGWTSVLPLAQPQQAPEVLVGWDAYLHEGRVTGTLTLLPPP
ncbi:hypothetical protein TSOC_002520 [Tetrabaena socialis]|uniref:BACK domain-containing protein n=1 Tax=Tetrabaena socialis TaxID=47790 RepID=A0A2J8ADW7_9CHLO|nr:hypothetical protein TSOC_002520 [Tetrabaena socialis]|eukprot:PNH10717.1 hypothetical protein TSOC_002520 [Tetrabaena socialis]